MLLGSAVLKIRNCLPLGVTNVLMKEPAIVRGKWTPYHLWFGSIGGKYSNQSEHSYIATHHFMAIEKHLFSYYSINVPLINTMLRLSNKVILKYITALFCIWCITTIFTLHKLSLCAQCVGVHSSCTVYVMSRNISSGCT